MTVGCASGLGGQRLVGATWLTAAPSSRFLRQPAILDFTLREPSRRARCTGLGVQATTGIFNENEGAMEDRRLYRVLVLNVSRSKGMRAVQFGDLESVKIDRSRLVRSSDPRAYVDGFALSTSMADLVITS